MRKGAFEVVNGRAEHGFMSSGETSAGKTAQPPPEATGPAGERRGDLLALSPWFLLVAVLAVGGLLLSARAGDGYTAAVGLLFAGFGVFLGFRVMGRMLP
jgi:hypothetical protein